jgi:DNA-binding MarR family transcriptional regulator
MKPQSTTLSTYQKSMRQMAAYRMLRARVNDVLASYGLNTTEWIILGLIYDHPNQLRVTDIARQIGVEGPLITKLVNELVKRAYLQSTPAKHDARARVFSLTPDSQKLVPKAERELATHLKILEKNLSEADLAAYFATLQIFVDNAKT